MIKASLIALSLMLSASTAEEPLKNPFEMGAEHQKTNLALIDKSNKSIRWLNAHSEYLITNKVPVMLIGGSEEDAKLISQKYRSLLIGSPDFSEETMKALFIQFKVRQLPVFIKDDIATYGDGG